MQKVLSILSILFFVGIFSSNAQCCPGTVISGPSASDCCSVVPQKSGEVKAYYFHATRRCETCQAVEKVTKETISKNYKGKVEFISINREETANKEMVKKYKVNGQTLLLVKGDKTIDLTSPAFMYARNKPEKLAAKLKSSIDSML